MEVKPHFGFDKAPSRPSSSRFSSPDLLYSFLITSFKTSEPSQSVGWETCFHNKSGHVDSKGQVVLHESCPNLSPTCFYNFLQLRRDTGIWRKDDNLSSCPTTGVYQNKHHHIPLLWQYMEDKKSN